MTLALSFYHTSRLPCQFIAKCTQRGSIYFENQAYLGSMIFLIQCGTQYIVSDLGFTGCRSEEIRTKTEGILNQTSPQMNP
jgi:hypothetical protein